MTSAAQGPSISRRSSQSVLLRVLAEEEALPRSELAQRTQLSRSAVNLALSALENDNLVEDAGYGESTGGRRPQMIRLARNASHTLGASMVDWNWIMILTDLHGHPVAEERAAMKGGDPEAAVEALDTAYRNIAPALAERRVAPLIGLGSPGLIDMNRGFIHSSVNLGWQDVPFGRMVTEKLGLEVRMTNRSKTSALAEARLSPLGKADSLVYIHIGLGVTAGLVIGGKLVEGSNTLSGELGHGTIIADGPTCRCGNRGCLQALISEDALRHRGMTMAYREASNPRDLTAEIILREADRGHEVFREVVREAAGYLAIAVGNLINLLDPDRIVLGGPVMEWSKLFIEETRKQVAFRAMRLPLSKTRIEAPSLGMEAGAIGAGLLIRDRALELLLPYKEAANGRFPSRRT